MTSKGKAFFAKVIENAVASLDELEEAPKARHAKLEPAPTALLNMTAEIRELREQISQLETENHELKERRASESMLNLDQLIPSPYQDAPFDEERVEKLVANLQGNPLNTPITVRLSKSQPGFYEILSGHNRVEAFRRLGRPAIPAFIVERTDDEAERLVFYDNLLAPNLRDYEKFKWFNRRRKSKNLSLGELSKESGIPTTSLFRLLSFEKLPEKTLEALEDKSIDLTAKEAEMLSKYAEVNPDVVHEVALLLSAGKIKGNNLATILPMLVAKGKGLEDKKSLIAARSYSTHKIWSGEKEAGTLFVSASEFRYRPPKNTPIDDALKSKLIQKMEELIQSYFQAGVEESS